MIEKKRENSPEENRKVSTDLNGADDDLESLSSDEKAAFDKIMAEIASATGTGSVDTSAEKSADDSRSETPHGKDRDNGSLEKQPSTEKNSTENLADNDMNEEQQAALDKIMSEISALNDSDQSGESKNAINSPGNEIDGDHSPEEDQEAALNKIMAEIEARKDIDKAADSKDPGPQASESEDDLSEDQEAALNKIMAEIEARKDNDKAADSKDPGPQALESEDDLSEDQEAALNKIMAEIEARKDGVQQDNSDKSIPSKDMDLSLDEFNQELTQLLSGGNSSGAEEETSASLVREDTGEEPSVNVDNKKEVNDALREILGNETPLEAQQALPAKDSGDASVQETSGDPSPSLEADYPILKEITAQEEPPASRSEVQKTRKAKAKKDRGLNRRLKKCLETASILCVAAVLALAGYWGYRNYGDQVVNRWFSTKIQRSSQGENMKPAANTTVDATLNNETENAPPAAALAKPEQPKPATASQPMTLTGLVAELDAARGELFDKIIEIQSLKSYYQKGIEEEEGKIEAGFKGVTLPSFTIAMQDPKIELSLKAVQRRSVYIKKIQAPLDALFSASEELLFFKRRTEMYNVLISYVSGFPVLDYQAEVQQIIDRYLEKVRGLSVDDIDINTTSLESVWNTIVADLRAKAASELAYELSNPKDRTISKEICSGNFDQKYLLTVLNPETARCLIKWNGKDLYLNELNHLTPEVAEILSQWHGEWLSLNGLKELSPQTAAQLANWPGKRLSLNGLTRLSAKTTVTLSKWQGEQLELIGLQAMGRWENYGTRLYLSEKLQRQLEGR